LVCPKKVVIDLGAMNDPLFVHLFIRPINIFMNWWSQCQYYSSGLGHLCYKNFPLVQNKYLYCHAIIGLKMYQYSINIDWGTFCVCFKEIMSTKYVTGRIYYRGLKGGSYLFVHVSIPMWIHFEGSNFFFFFFFFYYPAGLLTMWLLHLRLLLSRTLKKAWLKNCQYIYRG